MPLLGVVPGPIHGEEQHHGGLIRLLENLPDEPFERFGRSLRVAVVHGIFDHDEVRLLRQQIPFGTQRAVVGAGRANAGVDEPDLRRWELQPPPLGYQIPVSFLRLSRRRSGGNRAADDGNRDRIALARSNHDSLQPGPVTCADQRSRAERRIGARRVRKCRDVGGSPVPKLRGPNTEENRRC